MTFPAKHSLPFISFHTVNVVMLSGVSMSKAVNGEAGVMIELRQETQKFEDKET